jgi:MSHA biogenesis protein MshJ
MHPRLARIFNRLEALSVRERLMAIVGVPLLLVLVGEGVVFEQGRKLAADALKQAERQGNELKALRATLEALPVDMALPAPDELRRQRDELREQVDAARQAMGSAAGDASWTRVLRRTLAGTPGLTLAQLRTQPPEVVFSPAMLQPASASGRGKAASSAAANSAPSAATLAALAALDIDTVYRHRAELTVGGDLPRLLAYLKSLEAMPRDLHWIRVHVTASEYPQATAQLTLFTLSRRPETPFN